MANDLTVGSSYRRRRVLSSGAAMITLVRLSDTRTRTRTRTHTRARERARTHTRTRARKVTQCTVEQLNTKNGTYCSNDSKAIGTKAKMKASH